MIYLDESRRKMQRFLINNKNLNAGFFQGESKEILEEFHTFGLINITIDGKIKITQKLLEI